MVAEAKRVIPSEYPTFGIIGVCSVEGYGLEEVEMSAVEVAMHERAEHYTLQTNIAPANFYRSEMVNLEYVRNCFRINQNNKDTLEMITKITIHIIIFETALFKDMWDNSENLVVINQNKN